MHRQQAAPLVVAESRERVQRRPHATGQRLQALGLEQRHDAGEMRRADGSRVVDEDVDGAELALDLRERGVHRGAVAHVGVDRDAVAERGDRLPRRIEPDVERRDARPVGAEAVADRRADARAAAGDDRDPPGQAHAASGTATNRPRLAPTASRSYAAGHPGERDALDLDGDGAGAGERDDLRQLRACAPVREDDRRLQRHAAEAHRERAAGEPEQRDVPAGHDGARGQRERLVAAHAVEDHRGAAAAGRPLQFARAQSRRLQGEVGAAAGGHVEPLVTAVHGDDPRRADRLQDLDGDVPESAGSDHDRARPRSEQVASAADRVVGREPGIGQRRGGDGVEPIELDEEARRGDDHVLRQAAVATESGAASGQSGRAQVLRTDAARAAAAAPPRAVDQDGLARLGARGSRTERGHGAGDLVSQREGKLVRQRSGGPVHQVQVGVAEPGSGHAHEHLTRAGFGDRDVHQHGRALPGSETDRLHRATQYMN